jgi:ASCH domain-containing protein
MPEEVLGLGEPGRRRDRLVAAVLSGEKTATSSLLAQNEVDSEPLPVAGEERVVTGSAGKAVGRIVLTDVAVIRLGDADDGLAHDEGEGFASLSRSALSLTRSALRVSISLLNGRHSRDEQPTLGAGTRYGDGPGLRRGPGRAVVASASPRASSRRCRRRQNRGSRRTSPGTRRRAQSLPSPSSR